VLAALLALVGSISINKKPLEVKAGQTPSPREVEQASSLKGPTLTVVVQPNQTLSQITLRYLGRFDLKLLEEICQLNPDLKDPNIIGVGQRIRLPLDSNVSNNKRITAGEFTGSKFGRGRVGHE
jgi:LysM domain-containing protein